APGGIDLVAFVDRGAIGEEIELELGAVVAGGHGANTGGAYPNRGMAVGGGPQQHANDPAAPIHGAANKAVAVDDGVSDADAVVPAEIDQRAAEEGTARIGDDAASDEMERRLVDRVQQSAKMRILALEQLRIPLPLLELLVLGLEPVDFLE